jgi:hypothetical protein
MSSQGSFCIRSSHKFVNPPVQQEDTEKETNFYTSKITNKILQQSLNISTNQNTERKEGSNSGLAIRSTASSLEDFY